MNYAASSYETNNDDDRRKNKLLGILSNDKHRNKPSIDIFKDPRKKKISSDSDSDGASSETLTIRKKTTKTIKKSKKSKKSIRFHDNNGSDSDNNKRLYDDDSEENDCYDISSDSETEEIKDLYQKLGISINKKKYKTKINIKKDINDEIIDIPPEMDEEEFNKFNQIIVPSIVDVNNNKTNKKIVISKSKNNIEQIENESEEEEDNDYSKLLNVINSMKTSFSREKTAKQIDKIKKDAIIDIKKSMQKRRKYDSYADFKYFDSLRLFNIDWRSAILNDQNVEIPFIYLQSLQTGGVGAVPYNFFSCIQMLEAYGMTVETISESMFSCTYRAYFSGRIKQQIKVDDITAIREKAIEIEKERKKTIKEEGGASSGAYLPPKNTYKEMNYQNSESMGVDRLKEAKKLASKHERPIRLFNTRVLATEHAKKEKRKQMIYDMTLHLNASNNDDNTSEEDEEIDYLSDSNDDEETKKNEELLYEEDEEKVKHHLSEYDYLLNGFTREMVHSLNSSSKFLNKKSLDSIARNQTELSAWIENHLCIDICIFPGLDDKNSSDIIKKERQLLFMFTLQSQNPYTFLLMNLPDVEKKQKQLLE